MNLTRYRCHRIVGAAVIEIVSEPIRGLSTTVRNMTVRDAGDQMREVTLRETELRGYDPEPGDYLVQIGTTRTVVAKEEFEAEHSRMP